MAEESGNGAAGAPSGGMAPDRGGRSAASVIRAATARAVQKSALSLAASAGGRGASAAADGRPPRPRQPKFGPSTLLSTRGFKALRRMACTDAGRFPRRRADGAPPVPVEESLDALMALYRDWAHHFYAKFNFRDFVDKVERHCRTTTMKAYWMALQRSRADESGEGGPEAFDEVQYVVDKDAEEVAALLARQDEARHASDDDDDDARSASDDDAMHASDGDL